MGKVDLSSFSAYNFSTGVPKISVTENGVTFNQFVSSAMGYPDFVSILISDQKKQILIKPTSEFNIFPKSILARAGTRA